MERAAERIEDELGPIDVWVNNAMTTVFAQLADVAPDEFERATRVTYLGSVWGTMVALGWVLGTVLALSLWVGWSVARRD